jgi:predicted CXXCH cytochrome family protein
MPALLRQLRPRPRRWCAVAGCVVLCSLALSCSVRNNYKTLTFFFDGVPNPNAPVLVATNSGGLKSNTGELIPSKMYRHKPFNDGKCNECHLDKKHLVTTKAELCVRCHAPTVKQYPTMHAPVAIGQCLWCHEPHESDSPKLLKTTAPDLCLQCHDPALLPADVRPHLSPEQANCLYCHTGHGGAKPSMLLIDNPNVTRLSDRLNPTTEEAPADGGDQGSSGGTP